MWALYLISRCTPLTLSAVIEWTVYRPCTWLLRVVGVSTCRVSGPVQDTPPYDAQTHFGRQCTPSTPTVQLQASSGRHLKLLPNDRDRSQFRLEHLIPVDVRTRPG